MAINLERYKTGIFKEGIKETIGYILDHDLSDLLAEIFHIPLGDKDERRILNEYEKLVVLCKKDPEGYANKKYKLLTKIIEFVITNELQAPFLRIFARIYRRQNRAGLYKFLFREISDTWELMYIEKGKYVVGLDYDNKTFLLQDRLCWDEHLWFMDQQYKLMAGRITYPMFLKKLGLEKLKRFKWIAEEDVRRSRIICLMAEFITPKTLSILPDNWMNHEYVEYMDVREYMPTSFYKDKLLKRRYKLDRKGVIVRFQKNSLLDEILFLETIDHKQRPVVLFRFKFPTLDGYTVGYYHLTKKLFITVYSEGGHPVATKLNNKLCNFILEVYTELTCDFMKTDLDTCLLEDPEVDSETVNNSDKNIYYSCEIYSPRSTRTSTKRKKFTQKPHKRMYTIRTLPEGWKVSERAKKLAESYGIELAEGETFVLPYEVGVTRVRSEIKKKGRPKKMDLFD